MDEGPALGLRSHRRAMVLTDEVSGPPLIAPRGDESVDVHRQEHLLATSGRRRKRRHDLVGDHRSRGYMATTPFEFTESEGVGGLVEHVLG
jgi:hypothetical protein